MSMRRLPAMPVKFQLPSSKMDRWKSLITVVECRLTSILSSNFRASKLSYVPYMPVVNFPTRRGISFPVACTVLVCLWSMRFRKSSKLKYAVMQKNTWRLLRVATKTNRLRQLAKSVSAIPALQFASGRIKNTSTVINFHCLN